MQASPEVILVVMRVTWRRGTVAPEWERDRRLEKHSEGKPGCRICRCFGPGVSRKGDLKEPLGLGFSFLR